jgi:ribosomal protein S3
MALVPLVIRDTDTYDAEKARLSKELEETRAVLKDLLEERGLTHVQGLKKQILQCLNNALTDYGRNGVNVYINAAVKLAEQL